MRLHTRHEVEQIIVNRAIHGKETEEEDAADRNERLPRLRRIQVDGREKH